MSECFTGKRIFIFTGNHNTLVGISDYLDSLRTIFLRISKDVQVGNLFPPKDTDLFVIIESYCDSRREYILRLYEYLRLNNIPAMLIHTEFSGKNDSLNIFQFRDVLSRTIMPGFIPLFLFPRIHCNIFWRLTFLIVLLLFYVPLILTGFSFSEFRKNIYWKARSLALSRYRELNQYHACLSSDVHQSLMKHHPDLQTYYLRPLLNYDIIENYYSVDNISVDTSIVFMSGNLTSYRKNILYRLIRLTKSYDPFLEDGIRNNNTFGKQVQSIEVFHRHNLSGKNFIVYSAFNVIVSMVSYFNNVRDGRPCLFELYIGQTKKWKYHSPMRIIRSIRVGALPISIGNYNNSDISEVILEFTDISDFLANFTTRTPAFVACLMKNIVSYQEQSIAHNSITLGSLRVFKES